MATLQTIRNRGGLLVSIVIGLALLAFIVGDALSSGSHLLSGDRNQVGEIGGKSVSIIDYQNEVAKNEETVKIMNRTGVLTDEQQTMIRENTWNNMVMEELMNREYEETGISVSGDELYDMMLGDNIHPTVRQALADPQTGEIDLDRARLVIKSIMDSPGNDPNKIYWLSLEDEITTSRQLAKYNGLLAKSLFVTDEQAKETAESSATTSDISYIVKNYSTIDDSTITVSSSEIKDYYNKNQKRFEQPESRKIVYVNFDIAPSADDYNETEKVVADMVSEFAEIADPLEFVNLSSDQKADRNFYSKAEITNDSLANFLFSGKGGVFGPYLEDNAYKITRVATEKMLPDSVRARHILIQENDYTHALALADSLAGLLKKGANFESLAKTYSKDEASAINGGDLGWFNQKTMIQPFSDSAFLSKKNDIKVVTTQFGVHVLQVTDMAKPIEKVQIATVEKEILPSAKTTNKIYNDARTFATGIKTLEDFDKKVNESALTKRIASINKNDRQVAGMDNAREMVRQIYLSENPGKVVLTSDGTEIFENGNKYTVAVLTEISEEGIAPVNSVASNIKRILVQKKKADILKKELETAKSGSESLLSIAQKAGLEVKEASDISFNSFQIPGAGIEPRVIGAASISEQGKISEPIEGNQGVFLIMVNNRSQEEVTPEMVQTTKQGMAQANMYRANYQAMQAIMKNGEIKDTRYKFY